MTAALVTGASRGIGRATAIALSLRGDRVAVHYGRDATAAEETLGLLAGHGHVVVGGDLADAATAERVVADADAALGGIDVLVNNAGVAPSAETRHRVADCSFDDWQRAWRVMLDVDLMAPPTSAISWLGR